MGDLSDEELAQWLRSVSVCKYEPIDMQRMAREIVRHRATMKRLEEWGDELDDDEARDSWSLAERLRNHINRTP